MSDISNQILYEDNHLIVLNKLSGQIVQADKTGDVCLCDQIKAFIKQRDNKPGNVFCGVVHRIDRPVSGVVIFAKTSKALTRMNEAVKSRTVEKSYLAIVKPIPVHAEATLTDWIVRNEQQNKSYVYAHEVKNAKQASLTYRLIAQSKSEYGLLSVDLHTGRHHQIRAQLANIGSPIRGDVKYGAKRTNPDGSISLHSYKVSFKHPTRDELVTVVAPLPDDPLWRSFNEVL